MNRSSHTPGLVIPEVVAACVVIAVLAAAILLAAGESRRQSSLGVNLANLKQFASGTGAFAADNDDRVWAFNGPSVEHATAQAWEIMGRRSGLEAWLGGQPPSGWFPHVVYSHVVLLDYLGTHLPEQFTAAPEDHVLLLWQRDPTNFESLEPDVQRPGGFGPVVRRWVFTSSYELAPAFSARDARSLSPSATTLSQSIGGSAGVFNVGSLPLGGRRMSEVAFPAHKAMVYEQYQRHFGPRQLYFMYPEARVPVLFADGSVAVRRTGDANTGFHPNQPTTTSTTRVTYAPFGLWQPPTADGQSSNLVSAHYRWTRSGLGGRDFGGPEIPWID